MADAATPGPKAPLGVGTIISSTFSILTSNLLKVVLLGFAGALFGLIISSAFLGFGVATGTEQPDLKNQGAFWFGTVVSSLLNILVFALVTALLIQLAYDAKLGRSGSMGQYFKTALPALPAIVVLSIVVYIAMMIGLIALIVGGLWVFAVFYVMAPVAVIEKGGFGSLGRSAELTKEYRWPIVGLFILIVIISIVIQFVAGFVIALIAAALASTVGIIISGVLFAALNGLGYAIGGIAVALTYARLREIKEGVDVDQIAAVFD